MSCKIFIKVFDAKNVLNVDNIASNPYLRFWFKGKQESSIKTKTIYNTLNPVWDQNLEIFSDDYNSDILQVCMFTEDKETSFPITDIYEYPLRYRLLGEHFVFNEEIKKQKLNAGILHFELDFLISPESPFNKEILAEQKTEKENEESTNIPNDIQSDLLALKKENNELKQQFQEVIDQTAQTTSEIKADIQELKNENKKLFEKLIEKSDTNTETDQKRTEKYLIDSNDEKNYENDEKISEDEISIVYKTTDKRTLKTVCKKVLKIDKSKITLKDYEESVEKFEYLCSLHHPCISDAIGINSSETVKTADDTDSTTIAFFFEFCPNSLKNLIEKKMIDNTLKTKIVIEIAHALLYAHNHELIHRDISFDNVLLNSIFEVKIVNLGFSQICDSLFGNLTIPSQSSRIFISPELLGEKKFDFKTDVYSFGIMLFYVFCEVKPEFVNKKAVLPEPSPNVSEFCIQLISRCVDPDPNQRPSFKEILEEIRNNSYSLASDIDESIVSKRDEELIPYD